MPEERLFDKRDSLTNRFGDEELIFVNWVTFSKEPSFYIKEAGLTLPDPDYRIVRPASNNTPSTELYAGLPSATLTPVRPAQA